MSYENLVEEDAFLVLMSVRSLHDAHCLSIICSCCFPIDGTHRFQPIFICNCPRLIGLSNTIYKRIGTRYLTNIKDGYKTLPQHQQRVSLTLRKLWNLPNPSSATSPPTLCHHYLTLFTLELYLSPLMYAHLAALIFHLLLIEHPFHHHHPLITTLTHACILMMLRLLRSRIFRMFLLCELTCLFSHKKNCQDYYNSDRSPRDFDQV